MAHSEFNFSAADLGTLMKKSVGIARDAGSILDIHYAAYKKNSANIDIEIKDDESPVTNADKEVSAFIVEALQKLTPNIPVISEENEEDGGDSDLYWAVDPLDGTKEFLNKTDGFCVKIALIKKGTPIIGVVYCPAHQTTYFTHADYPAFKISPESRKSLQSGAPLKKGELTTLFNLTHADPALYTAQRSKLKKKGLKLPKEPDNSPGLPRNLQVAEGLADIHLGTGTDSTLQEGGGYIWDTAPDFLLLKNAGGSLLSLYDGKPMHYPPTRKRMPSYIALGDKKLGKRLFP